MKKIFVNGYGSIGSRITSFLKDDPEITVIGVGKYSPDNDVNIAISRGLNVYVPERKKDDFKDPASNKLNMVYYGVAYFSLVCFFLVGIIIMVVGLADPKFTKTQNNHNHIEQVSLLATVGFYFILMHCSFALGMFTFKKFGSLLSDKRFDEMFENQHLDGSFYNLLDGLK